jgi:hypothetical protein
LQQRLARHTAFAQGVLENSAELPFEQTILITELLFFPERYGVLRLLAPRTLWSVHARRVIFPLKRF